MLEVISEMEALVHTVGDHLQQTFTRLGTVDVRAALRTSIRVGRNRGKHLACTDKIVTCALTLNAISCHNIRLRLTRVEQLILQASTYAEKRIEPGLESGLIEQSAANGIEIIQLDNIILKGTGHCRICSH